MYNRDSWRDVSVALGTLLAVLMFVVLMHAAMVEKMHNDMSARITTLEIAVDSLTRTIAQKK